MNYNFFKSLANMNKIKNGSGTISEHLNDLEEYLLFKFLECDNFLYIVISNNFLSFY